MTSGDVAGIGVRVLRHIHDLISRHMLPASISQTDLTLESESESDIVRPVNLRSDARHQRGSWTKEHSLVHL